MPTSPPAPPLPPLILLDGGLGTTLADRYAITFSTSTPLWSSHLLLTPSGQATLKTAQSSFAHAGADVILTATYQASFEGFERSGVGEKQAEEYMRRAVGIARDVADDGEREAKVALGLGAYGAVMVPSQEYSGEYDEEHASVVQLREWHSRRIKAFMPEGCWKKVDFVAFETIPRIEEVLAIRQAMEGVNGGLGAAERKGFWITCVFPREGNCLPDRSTVGEAVQAMLGRGRGEVPMGVGINCTRAGKVEWLVLEFEREIEGMFEREESNGGGWPSLVVYPDGTRGEAYDTVKKEWVKSEEGEENSDSWDETIFGIVSRARERRLWKSIFVGGCCKTTPYDIGKLRKLIDGSS